MTYVRCIHALQAAAGREFDDATMEALFKKMDARFERLRDEQPGLSEDDLWTETGRQIGREIAQAAAIEKRNMLENLAKRRDRRTFYESAPDVRGPLGGVKGIIVGIEARLVGVARAFTGGRLSADARGRALTRELVGGMASELDRAGLFETFRRGDLDRDWARELYNLNRVDAEGHPIVDASTKTPVTGNREALEIAKIVRKYQRLNLDILNRAGAWIGQLDGYISRTSHDPDAIRRAGRTGWKEYIAPLLDDTRTFEGVEDADDFMNRVYDGLVSGVHLTQEGMAGFKDPAFTGPGNLAKRLSQGRVLHFRDADAWLDYHRIFGMGRLSESIIRNLEYGARNAGLMEVFGTNPRAELEADLRWVRENHRDDVKLMEQLRRREPAYFNRMSELDGVARTPVNRMAASIESGWRAWQNMAKLGGVVISAFGDVPIKAAELNYQGIGLLEAYWDGLVSLFRGRGTGETREIMDLLRAGTDGMRGNLASRFDAEDTPPGTLASLANLFFRFTGLTYWTDAQRAGAELMMARHVGRQRSSNWQGLQEQTRRTLDLFGIDAGKWDMLRAVEWKQADGYTYLTPDIGRKVSNESVAAYLKARGRPRGKRAITRFKEDLALSLAAYYSDRGEFAVIQPGAKERAIMLQGTQPGTPLGLSLRAIMQFKAFPVSVITKAWAREIYGGRGGFGKTAGLVHMVVATAVFGYASMAAKDALRGRTPRNPTDPKTWGAALAQGGGAGIYGDFIVGEYSRFGRSALATLAGPTFGQLDDLIEIWSRVKSGDDVAAQTLRTGLQNTPFGNLFYIRPAIDYLLLYQIQEALNPGYLRRFERRVERENQQQFFMKPSSVIPRGGGRPFEALR